MQLLLTIACLLIALSDASLGSPQLTEPNTSQNLPWRCYAPRPELTPTTWPDCTVLASEISNLASRRERLIFSTETDVDVDYVIPHTFIYGSCSAVIGPIDQHAQFRDGLYARYLSRMIVNMAERCVLPPPHLGGRGEIGNNQGLALALLGPKSPGSPAAKSSFNLTSIL